MLGPSLSPARPPVIVLADDDRVTRDYVAELLRSHGATVDTFANGRDCVERVKRGDVDLVLLDIVMPGLSGIDTCRLIKTMSKDAFVPVLLLTARADLDSRVEGLRIGADDYVTKPFDERELIARVSTMLRIKRMHDNVNAAKTRLEQLAIRDELTGLYNYRYVQTRLHEEFKRAERYREPLACAMVDIDYFKQFNDTFGHDTGDRVLAHVARAVRDAVREIDVVARYGGEEFLLLLPSTHFSGALVVAERVFRAVTETSLDVGGTHHRVTISMGVATYPSRDVKSKEQLIKAADTALYQAKNTGRNRVCVFQHDGYIYQPGATPAS